MYAIRSSWLERRIQKEQSTTKRKIEHFIPSQQPVWISEVSNEDRRSFMHF